jgi:hypothetical protein
MDDKELMKALKIYFESTNESDEAKMNEVFHDSAHLYGEGPGGELLDWDKDSFLNVIKSTKEASRGKDFPVYNEIVSIDFTSANTAVVRLKVRVMDLMYTDILSFICLNGRWWIIAKLAVGVPV